ncbi:MAG: WYL domain-containing protein [Planctomycetales bacterium]|nr:WYL domain-containing protein [Planctomycetales bacterium]
MARNEQLIRQHKLLQILERYRFGRTLPDLRDELVDELGLGSLHERSVRRDLEALQAAGIDVDVHESGQRKVWKLGPLFRGSHKITASATELIALALGRDLMLPLAGTPFWLGIESFWSKLQEGIPDSVAKHYEKFRQIVAVRGNPAKTYRKQEGILSTINRAIQQHRVVEAEYKRLGQDEPQRRQIEPYGVVVYQSSIYIVAAVHGAEGAADPYRHFKLDRFHKAEALDVYFQPDDKFDLASHLAESLGMFSSGKPKDFRIHISAFAAPFVLEDPWQAEQKVEHRKDGSIVLTVKAAHELDIIPRVLALGSDAEILAPAACRKQMADIVQRMADRYR